MNNPNLTSSRWSVLTAIGLAVILISIAQLNCASPDSEQTKSIRVGTSLRVFELILNEIIGEPNQVLALVGDNQSPHAFHPKPSDAVRMHQARMVILGAPELDGWVSEMSDLNPIYLADHLSQNDWIYSDEVRNPHFWVDPVIVSKLCEPIANELCKNEPSRCNDFLQNARRFQEKLESLDEKLRAITHDLSGFSVYTTQPFFDYFLRRYRIKSAGSLEPIPGQEPPPSRIVRMLKNELESPSGGIVAQVRLPDITARLFQSESGLPIVYLDPIGDSSTDSYSSLLIQNAHLLSEMLTTTE